MNDNPDKYNLDFNLNSDLIHVNHAAVAPWPLRTQIAVQAFAEENTQQGSLNYLQWIEHESNLRVLLQGLINAESADEIGLLKSTSEALSVVAYGIDWAAGDSVVTSAEEFPSNRLLWLSLEKLGVEVRLVSYETDDDAEQLIIDACDDSTRLISISAVQYASGRRTDLARIGDYCETNNTLFCVDAIQQIGALTFDVQAIKADFVAADGHKWMMGAEGLALFYCKKEHLELLKLHQYGWHMIEKLHDFETNDYSPAKTARRFECGSPNTMGIIALEQSLVLLETTGMDAVETAVLNNTEYLIDAFSNNENIDIISSTDPAKRSGIIVVKHKEKDSDELFEYLKQHHVLCAPRGGGIRFSPHYYTPRKKLEQLVELLKF